MTLLVRNSIRGRQHFNLSSMIHFMHINIFLTKISFQADVGKALAHLKMPGVGSLSQSTICRFESLTLSHNNMVALKPILHSWLEKAEEAMKQKDGCGDISGILPNTDKKRKRTSIAAPEKRLLEDYFRQQPRPSGERIAAIADKLDLKKNVVRVWFCNQRQKQKRY
ncbi:Pou domain - to homeobox domain protein [Ancylostoma ceylanicum]|uniref:POU domain protein n=1 Tax=Ancylostoma ceylanicum TaxID=53326 RepID=A0A0D6LPJ0_9BILA|nr:Pou domain - to homeobox domain protein [Ancylostoma ceylanicum]